MIKKKNSVGMHMSFADYSFNVGKALEFITTKASGTKKIANLFAAQVLLFEETKRLEPKKVKKKVGKKLEPKTETVRVGKKKIRVTKQASDFMRPMKPSDVLAEIVGSTAQPRTRIVSKVWDYVKKHNLQNPKNKRNIICDDKLQKIFLKKEVSMLEMAGLIGKNLTPVK